MNQANESPLTNVTPVQAVVLEYQTSDSAELRARLLRESLALGSSANLIGGFTVAFGTLAMVVAGLMSFHVAVSWAAIGLPALWMAAGLTLVSICPLQREHYPPRACVLVLTCAVVAMLPYFALFVLTLIAWRVVPWLIASTPFAAFFAWSGIRTMFFCIRYWHLAGAQRQL